MTYQVLYRVFRPQAFNEMVGQEHIRRTLENAITNNRISHAYLFCGPRGTGKTTIARILAKALNCANPKGFEPCGECESCKAISEGSSMDVMEIDGASNRGIDQIRDLREKIGFLPSMGKYRVIIIDEVHMLSTEAFNALLKTLEEPPSHVIFILATTDPQKVPATILSRCQRFDFRKIKPSDIKGYLQKILESQNMTAQEEAIDQIVRKSEGGMRDAISLLDQAISFTEGNELKYEEVCQVLGMMPSEELCNIIDFVINKDSNNLFITLNTIFSNGTEPVLLLKDMTGYLRNLLLLSLCTYDTKLVNLNAFVLEKAKVQSEKLGPRKIEKMISRLDEILSSSKYKGNLQYMAECYFAEMIIEDTPPVLIQKPVNEKPVATVIEKPGPVIENIEPVFDKSEPVTVPAAEEKPKETSSLLDQYEKAQAAVERKKAIEKEETKKPSALSKMAGQGFSFDKFLLGIKDKSIILHAYLRAVKNHEFKDNTLTIYFDPEFSFHKGQCELPNNTELINNVVNVLTGEKTNVKFAFEEEKEKDPFEKAKELFGENIISVKKD